MPRGAVSCDCGGARAAFPGGDQSITSACTSSTRIEDAAGWLLIGTITKATQRLRKPTRPLRSNHAESRRSRSTSELDRFVRRHHLVGLGAPKPGRNLPALDRLRSPGVLDQVQKLALQAVGRKIRSERFHVSIGLPGTRARSTIPGGSGLGVARKRSAISSWPESLPSRAAGTQEKNCRNFTPTSDWAQRTDPSSGSVVRKAPRIACGAILGVGCIDWTFRCRKLSYAKYGPF